MGKCAKWTKKAILLFVSLTLAVGLMPSLAFAASGATGGGSEQGTTNATTQSRQLTTSASAAASSSSTGYTWEYYNGSSWTTVTVKMSLAQTNYAYDGYSKYPAAKLVANGKTLVEYSDYTLQYVSNAYVGTAVVIARGTGNYKGAAAAFFTIRDQASIEADRQAFESGKLTGPKNKTYTGKAIKPGVKLVANGETLVKGRDYTLSYKNNKKVGVATVIVKGIDRFEGASRTCKFKILPKKAALKSVTAKLAGKKIAVKWSKAASSYCTGYQVRYSTNKNMSKAKVKTLKKNTTTSCTLPGLKSGKRYYVQVRTYKTVNGKNYYSAWSASKSAVVPKCGSASGVVTSAKTGKTISGAWVYFYTTSGKFVYRVKANSKGRYSIKNLAAGRYRIKIKHSGYKTLSALISVKANKNTYCENALLVKSYTGKGYAKGTITNASTGRGISGAKLVFRKGWGTKTGTTVGSCKTASDGSYSIKLKAGYYTAKVTRSGYITTYVNIVVGKGTTNNQNGAMVQRTSNTSSYRAVLTWGATPTDLDSHLVSTGSAGTSHVYYRNKNGYVSGTKVANLDTDDVTSYGPETVTFKMNKNRTYVYYVQQFSSKGNLTTSSAKVKLYKGNTLLRTYTVRSTGSGRCWNVFKIVKGKIKDVQTISDYPKDVSTSTGKEGRANW